MNGTLKGAERGKVSEEKHDSVASWVRTFPWEEENPAFCCSFPFFFIHLFNYLVMQNTKVIPKAGT